MQPPDVGTIVAVVGLAMLLLTNVVVMAVGWGSMTTKVEEFRKATNARLLQIEKALGVEDANEVAFLRRSEATLMTKNSDEWRERMEARARGWDRRLERIEARFGAAVLAGNDIDPT